jgi:hypothetical protein
VRLLSWFLFHEQTQARLPMEPGLFVVFYDGRRFGGHQNPLRRAEMEREPAEESVAARRAPLMRRCDHAAQVLRALDGFAHVEDNERDVIYQQFIGPPMGGGLPMEQNS